jgi:hypothetical protein
MMKKSILLAAAIILTTTTVACKRKRNCICTKHYIGYDTTWTSVHGDTIFKDGKKDARALCDGLDGEVMTFLTETYWLDCELEKDMD